MEVTIKQIFDSDFVKRADMSKFKLFVNNQKVWDYKIQDKELRLIHEPVEGSDTYEQITLAELRKTLTLEEIEYPMVSETTGGYVKSVIGLKKAEGPVGLDFVVR